MGKKGKRKKKKLEPMPAGQSDIRTIDVTHIPSRIAPSRVVHQTGEKFPGGFGITQLLRADYWTLRARSAQLFEENLYARGLIRRLVVNEINTGLHLEATPAESVLGFPTDELADWTEDTESRFEVWADSPRLCDHVEQSTFGELQAAARAEALIAGDVLVMLQQDQRTRLPRIRLINGAMVRNPLGGKPRKLAKGNRIIHGVELDKTGRHVAYWIQQDVHAAGVLKFESKRIPAFGEKSGRRLAWLVYGTDKRLNDVRGKPLLSLVLQSLKEIDRYRDSTQRKATINSMLAMFIQKDEDKAGTLPMGGGALRKGVEVAVDSTGTDRSFNVAEQIPGMVIDELQHGEVPHGFNSAGTDEKFGEFEEAIIQTVAWANHVPPEILRLAFSNNYSASQAAINEFKIYLNAIRTFFGSQFCKPVYVDWLLSEVLNQNILAAGLLEAWRNAREFMMFAAWVTSDWSGQIKPAVDPSKLAKGYEAQIEMGVITRERTARELNGMKFSKVIAKLKIENEQLAEANAPLAPAPALPPAAEAPPESEEDEDEGQEEDELDEDERNAS